jgi:hypothetical protein
VSRRLFSPQLFCGSLLLCLSPLGAQDFSVAVTPSSQTVWQAQSISYLVTVTATGGFSGVVSFSATGFPAGATAGFNPATVTGSGTSTMTMAASPGTPTGTSHCHGHKRNSDSF